MMARMMASGDELDIHKIRTTEIVEELKQAGGDNTNFFYLLVSTSGKEDETRLTGQLPKDQPINDGHYDTESDSEKGETESEEDNDDEQMETTQPNCVLQNPFQPTMPPEAHNSRKKARKVAMNEVHQRILPDILYPVGWKKVYDKDQKSTYRALYFSNIKREPDEDEITHNRRVGEIRERIREEVKLLQEELNVNFKINSLLSKPILYDKPSPEEQSLKAAFTNGDNRHN